MQIYTTAILVCALAMSAQAVEISGLNIVPATATDRFGNTSAVGELVPFLSPNVPARTISRQGNIVLVTLLESGEESLLVYWAEKDLWQVMKPVMYGSERINGP